jgi:hypothetical protein
VGRSTRTFASRWGSPNGSCPTRPAGEWAGSPPGCTLWLGRRPPRVRHRPDPQRRRG